MRKVDVSRKHLSYPRQSFSIVDLTRKIHFTRKFSHVLRKEAEKVMRNLWIPKTLIS